MKKINRICAAMVLFTVVGGMLTLAGCSANEDVEVTESTTESTTVSEEETTATTEKEIWTPSDAGIADNDAIMEQINSILFDTDTLTNPTLISYAEKFKADGLDLINLKTVEDYLSVKSEPVVVTEGFRATNVYAEYTSGVNVEDTTSIISAFAVAFPTTDEAMDFFNEKSQEYMETFPDLTIDKSDEGLSFNYSSDDATVWMEYDIEDGTVVSYEEYKIV